MKYSLIILLLMICAGCLAQTTVTGTIKNEQAKPLQNTTVRLLNKHGSTDVQIAQTNSDGQYQFAIIVPGTYLMGVSLIGKKDTALTFVFTGKDTTEVIPDIIMAELSDHLQSVTVTAPNKPAEAKNGKLIFNIEKTISATGTNAFDQLRRTPGITVDGDDAILLKGSTANIMVDGKMTYLTSQQLTTYLKSLPAESLTRIEVMATPSSEYDAAGNAGIINIVTKKAARQGYALNLNAGGGAGRYVQTNEGIIGNIRTKALNVFGSYNYNYNHSYLKRTSYRTITNNGNVISYDRQSYDPSYANNNGYKAGIDFYLNKQHELGIVYTGSNNHWERNAAGPTYLRNVSGKIDSIVQNKNITIEPSVNNAFNLNYKWAIDTLGKQLTIDADNASYKRNSIGSLDNGLYNVNGAELQPYQSLAFTQPGNITIRSLKADAVLPYKKWSLKTGVKYASITSDNDFVYDSLINGSYVYSRALSNHFIYTEKVAAAYASVNKQLNKTLAVDAGLRVEHTSSNGNSITSNIVTPRRYTNLFPFLSITKTLAGDNSLNVSITRRINRPVYANLNPFRYFFDKYSYVEGNPYLQPELSWNGSASFTYQQDYIVTVNYTRTSNAMLGFALQDSAAGILRISTYNFSHKDAADILFIVPVKPTSFWSIQNTIDISYLSYLYALYAGGKEIFHPQRVSIDVQMVQSFKLPRSIGAELTMLYTSPTISGVYVLQPYFQVDVGFKKSFLQKKLDVNLAVADVCRTDRYWGYSIYGPTNVRYNHRPDTRRAKLALTYHVGGKLSAGKTHRLEEQERL